MKHLRRFNENTDHYFYTEKNKEDLREFCHENLIALLDEGFSIVITKRDSLAVNNKNHKKGFIVNLNKRTGFTWDEIKDYYLPFLDRLSKVYAIEPVITLDLSQIISNLITDNQYVPVGREHYKIEDLEKYDGEEGPSIKISRILVMVEGRLNF